MQSTYESHRIHGARVFMVAGPGGSCPTASPVDAAAVQPSLRPCRIDVDAAGGRIHMVDGPRFAFDLSGLHLVGVPRPSINMRLVRLEPDGHLLVSVTPAGVGLERVVMRGGRPAGEVPAQFFRVTVRR